MTTGIKCLHFVKLTASSDEVKIRQLIISIQFHSMLLSTNSNLISTLQNPLILDLELGIKMPHSKPTNLHLRKSLKEALLLRTHYV